MTVVGVLILIPAIIIFIAIVMNAVARSGQRMKSHDKCEFCGARLKKISGGKFASGCRKCGRAQSWA